MPLFDISPPLSETSPVYPGDEPFSREWSARIGADSPANLSVLRFSPHIGAHTDAPLHYAAGADGIDAADLERYLGPCRVVHALGVEGLVGPAHLEHAADGLPPRVLVRTRERAARVWDPGYAAFAPELIGWLAERGVRLVGIDTPSADPFDSQDLPSHGALYRHDVRILENLVLDAVEEGDYELIALPLRIVGADASPVRAVLRRG